MFGEYPICLLVKTKHFFFFFKQFLFFLASLPWSPGLWSVKVVLWTDTPISAAPSGLSLVFMLAFAWWFPLLSGVADSGAFHNRCIYTEIMWHLDCTQVNFIYLIMWLLKVIGCTIYHVGAS
jgi:hypothetical protein